MWRKSLFGGCLLILAMAQVSQGESELQNADLGESTAKLTFCVNTNNLCNDMDALLKEQTNLAKKLNKLIENITDGNTGNQKLIDDPNKKVVPDNDKDNEITTDDKKKVTDGGDDDTAGGKGSKVVGTLDENDFTCKNCPSDIYAEDCSGIMDGTQRKNGIYTLNPHRRTIKPFRAYCERHMNEGWTIIQRRIDGAVDFYRNWTDFKNGFGNLNGEYWLGLDRIHKLTSRAKYQLWIEMENFRDEISYAKYSEFSVAGESDLYKLKISGFSGNVVDHMTYNNLQKFTTLDRDNDGWGYNCADDRKSAWWHLSCSYVNFNGQHKNLKDKTAIYLNFYNVEPLKYVHMAIRPA